MNNISLETLLNCFFEIRKDFDYFRISRVIRKSELKINDSHFLSWQTSIEDQIFLDQCFCENCIGSYDDFPEELIEKECSGICLNYYVDQRSVGMEGDSFEGDLVYSTKDHYVFVEYRC